MMNFLRPVPAPVQAYKHPETGQLFESLESLEAAIRHEADWAASVAADAAAVIARADRLESLRSSFRNEVKMPLDIETLFRAAIEEIIRDGLLSENPKRLRKKTPPLQLLSVEMTSAGHSFAKGGEFYFGLTVKFNREPLFEGVSLHRPCFIRGIRVGGGGASTSTTDGTFSASYDAYLQLAQWPGLLETAQRYLRLSQDKNEHLVHQNAGVNAARNVDAQYQALAEARKAANQKLEEAHAAAKAAEEAVQQRLQEITASWSAANPLSTEHELNELNSTLEGKNWRTSFSGGLSSAYYGMRQEALEAA